MKFAISAMHFSIDSSARYITATVRRSLVRAKYSSPSIAGEESKRLSGPNSSIENKEPEPCYVKDIFEKDRY